MSPDTGLHEILARGFPWRVTQSDVQAFFANVKMFGGYDGIKIRRNVAMEATFYVDSKNEVHKAMSRDKKQFDSRIIHGKCQFILIFLNR